jgi:hypothetical protein
MYSNDFQEPEMIIFMKDQAQHFADKFGDDIDKLTQVEIAEESIKYRKQWNKDNAD